MKIITYLSMIGLLIGSISCQVEDDYVPFEVEKVFVENPNHNIQVNIVYVQPADPSKRINYRLNEQDFINHLNGSFFNRYDIGLELGTSSQWINDELFDLKDNRGEESETFLKETASNFDPNKLTIYIMKRSNTVAIAGIGKDQRALITDEFLYETTAPHEIGHALGLTHYAQEGNIMSEILPHQRKEFTSSQIERLINQMNRIKSN